MPEATQFPVGSLVKFKAAFLQSTGWSVDVPIDGKVTGHNSFGWPQVQWCDREDSVTVNPRNLLRKEAPDYTGM